MFSGKSRKFHVIFETLGVLEPESGVLKNKTTSLSLFSKVSFILVFSMLLVTVVEIWLLIQVGLGSNLYTVFVLCGITIAAGWWLMRGEDFSLWTLIEIELQNRRLPTEEVLNDFIIWCCGLALIFPGFLTDGLAFTMLLPPIRQEGIRWIRKKIRGQLTITQPEIP